MTGSAARWFAPGFLDRDARRPRRARARDARRRRRRVVRAAAPRRSAPSTAPRDLAGARRARRSRVSGEHDAVTTPASMQDLADDIPGARHVALDGASHLAVLEEPAGRGRAHRRAPRPRSERAAEASGARDRGMRVRRAVLGDAHVDRAVAATTARDRRRSRTSSPATPGARSGRDPGSRAANAPSRRSRASTTGGHEDEIAMHVRAALRNGLSRDEIAEVLLHTALYAGLPAANAAFAIAREVFAEADAAEPIPHPTRTTEPGDTMDKTYASAADAVADIPDGRVARGRRLRPLGRADRADPRAARARRRRPRGRLEQLRRRRLGPRRAARGRPHPQGDRDRTSARTRSSPASTSAARSRSS